MRWALRIGSIYGIAIRIHFTFLFLLAFLLSVGVLRPRPPGHQNRSDGRPALRVGPSPRQVNAQGLLREVQTAGGTWDSLRAGPSGCFFDK